MVSDPFRASVRHRSASRPAARAALRAIARPVQALLLSLVLASSALSQDTTAVATVDGIPITASEFTTRLSLTVFPSKDAERLKEVVKRQFLYAMIGERLLAAEAARRGLDAEQHFKDNTALAEEMFARDKLYRDSVRSRVTVTRKEIQRRFDEDRRRVEYQFLYSPDERNIRAYERLLSDGLPFDSLLAAQTPADSAALSARPEGERDPIEPELARAMRSMKAGQVSQPVRTPSGWYILRKVDYGSLDDGDATTLARLSAIERRLRGEKETRAAVAFVRRLWKGGSAVIADGPYRRIGQALLDDVRAQARADTSDILMPDASAYDTLRAAFGPRLRDPFATIDSAVFTIEDFLLRLEASTFRFSRGDLKRFPTLFRAAVQDMLDKFVVTREAYRLGLESSEDVRNDLAQWRANGLAQELPDMVWEQFIASDDSVWAFYCANGALFGPPPEVRILELFVTDSARMQAFLGDLERGTPLRALAEERSERSGAKGRHGELGFFPVTAYGAIGRAAFGREIGERVGPVRTSDGWSVFSILDWNYPDAVSPRNLAGVRRRMDAVAREPVMRAKTDELVIRLASRARIAVNERALQSIDVTPLQMFTIRFLGFGGRIPAAPAVMPIQDGVIEGMSRSAGANP